MNRGYWSNTDEEQTELIIQNGGQKIIKGYIAHWPRKQGRNPSAYWTIRAVIELPDLGMKFDCYGPGPEVEIKTKAQAKKLVRELTHSV